MKTNRPSPDPVDGDFLKKTYEDLGFLKSHWQETSDLSVVKQTGAILRRLINEDHLRRAGEFLNLAIKVYTSTLSSSASNEGVWQNAGAKFDGIQVSGIQIELRPFS